METDYHRPLTGVRQERAQAILAVLNEHATADQLRRLTERQWQKLAIRAGVLTPSPLLRQVIIAKIENRVAL